MDNSNSKISNSLFSFALGLALCSIIFGAFSLWKTSSIQDVPSSRYGIAASLALILIALLKLRFNYKELRFNYTAFSSSLLFIFLSDWQTRSYNYLLDPPLRGEIIFFFILSFLAINAKRTDWIEKLYIPSIILLSLSFLSQSEGRLIYSDDHPVFFYRLDLLKSNFPNIPVYNTLWSAGRDTMHLFATGSLNVFFLFAPLIYLFELAEVYNYIIILVLFFLTPASTYLAAKIYGLSKRVSLISACLSLCSSSLWYQWGLQFGTMGFITSAALIPLNLALSAKILCKTEEIKTWELVLFFFSFSLMLFWTASGLVFIPLIIFALLRAKSYLKNPKLVALAFLLCLLHLPWITFFWQGWEVSSFLSTDTPSYTEMHQVKAFKHKASGINIEESIKLLRETANRTNPLHWLFCLPGIFLLPRIFRIPILVQFGWLFVMGTLLVTIKPQLEFDRMLVILLLCGSIPAALVIQKVVESTLEKNPLQKLLGSLILAYLVTGIFGAIGIVNNKTLDRYFFSGNSFKQVSNVIKQEAKTGRVLFSGHVLHHLNHGHLAPLSISTNKPMLASSHLHEHWKYAQIFPRYFLEEKPKRINDYLNLHNVSLIAAHEEDWVNYFNRHPEHYSVLIKAGRFLFFKYKDFPDNYFQEGKGEIIEQSNSGLKLKLSTTNAVIKFKFNSNIESSDCNLSEKGFPGGIKLVKLSNCPLNKEISVKSKSFLKRLLRH